MSDHWYKRNPRAYYEGTRQLTLEERGAYCDVLDLIYMHEGNVPDDDKWMSHALHVSTRKWRALRTALIEAGKIESVDGLISNQRARAELEERANQRRTNSETALNRERTKRQKYEKPNEINESEARSCTDIDIELDREKIETTTTVEDKAARAPHWKAVADACMEAIGEAADPMAIGLVAVAEPLGWIAQGADLDLDILPAIRALSAAKAKTGERISSWKYFAGRVAKNRANREAGLPSAEPDKPVRRKLTRYQGLVEVAA